MYRLTTQEDPEPVGDPVGVSTSSRSTLSVLA